MKRLSLAVTLLSAHMAYAYEYKLQFTPPSGATGITVAGYQFVAGTVTGNCSYEKSSGGRYSHPVWYYNTCTWDLYGNMISLNPVSSPPAVPPILSTNGTEIIFASSGSSTTGKDTRGFGFISTPSAHYSWQTTNGGYAVIPDNLYTVAPTLVSDGDFPLVFDGASVTASITGIYVPTAGTASVSSTTCSSSVPPGSTCSVTISYDPRTIKCTGSPYGYGYTGIQLSLATDSAITADWTERFTITGMTICDD